MIGLVFTLQILKMVFITVHSFGNGLVEPKVALGQSVPAVSCWMWILKMEVGGRWCKELTRCGYFGGVLQEDLIQPMQKLSHLLFEMVGVFKAK